MNSALCFIIDSGYVVGLVAFLNSLRKTNPHVDVPALVFHRGDLTPPQLDLITASYPDVVFRSIDVEPYRRCRFSDYRDWGLNPAYRFELFRVQEYDYLLYFDADMLVLGDISPLFEFRGDLGACPIPPGEGMELKTVGGFNAGMLILGRAVRTPAIWRTIMSIAEQQEWSGNQVILNRAVKDFYEPLPAIFNASTCSITPQSLREVRIAHFVGRQKPWESPPFDDHQSRQAGEEVCRLLLQRWTEHAPPPEMWTSAVESGTQRVSSSGRRIACCVVTPDFLDRALAVWISLKEAGCKVEMHVLVTREPSKPPGVTVTSLQDLCAYSSLAQQIEAKYRHDQDALRWSLKPVFIAYLLEQYPDAAVMYCDADLFFAASPEELFESLSTGGVVLTPHWRPRRPDLSQRMFRLNFVDGMFNAGLVAANSKGRAAMRWWAEVCLDACEKNHDQGLHDDQRYLDLMPIHFPEVVISRHLGYNLAAWNLHLRYPDQQGVQEVPQRWPVRVIHFTGSTIRSIEAGEDPVLKPYLAEQRRVQAAAAALLRSHTQSNVGALPATQIAHTAHRKPDYAATVILLNWKRPFNLPRICEMLRNQNVKLKIVVWSNESMPDSKWDLDDFVYARSNLVCWPRWFMAAQVDTDYLICMDDDLCPERMDAMQSLLECADRYASSNNIIGIEGVRLTPSKPYFPTGPHIRLYYPEEEMPDDSSVHFMNVRHEVPVDIVKGRLMVMRPQVLKNLPMAPAYYQWCDDIVVSAHVAAGRPRPHILAPLPEGAFRDMEGKLGPMALTIRASVREERERARRHYFSYT